MLLKCFFLMFSLFFFNENVSQNDCKSIESEVKISDTTGGSSNGQISIKLVSEGKFELFLIAEKAENNRLNIEDFEIKNLPKGNYELAIVEKKEGNYCPKHLKVTVR